MDDTKNVDALQELEPADWPLLSVITPVYFEEKNLPVFYRRLCNALDGQALRWQWLIIDDHSGDGSFNVASAIAAADSRVSTYRFSRNFGSHTAMQCGLDHAAGNCAVVMAADLQDPPECIPTLLEQWRAGNKVVWAVRGKRNGVSRSSVALSRAYYRFMRNMAGLRTMPASGADFVLLDSDVVDAICRFRERNTSLYALLTWIGFRQAEVVYDKQARLHGRSRWTFGRKIKLAIDSVAAFTYQPIRWISALGLSIALIGLAYAIFIVGNAIVGQPIEGWSSLMVAILVLGGGQMLMLGVLGEYLWRALDEARDRPRYILESEPGLAADMACHRERRDPPIARREDHEKSQESSDGSQVNEIVAKSGDKAEFSKTLSWIPSDPLRLS